MSLAVAMCLAGAVVMLRLAAAGEAVAWLRLDTGGWAEAATGS